MDILDILRLYRASICNDIAVHTRLDMDGSYVSGSNTSTTLTAGYKDAFGKFAILTVTNPPTFVGVSAVLPNHTGTTITGGTGGFTILRLQ
jgi:hypothetical protein